MELHLHTYDERDIQKAEIGPVCLIVYSCCEDDHVVIYLLDDHEGDYFGEMKQAA